MIMLNRLMTAEHIASVTPRSELLAERSRAMLRMLDRRLSERMIDGLARWVVLLDRALRIQSAAVAELES
jgi:hypothetical protein